MLSYLFYILKHKYNVFRQGIKLLKFCNWYEKIQLLFRLIIHDYSKFGPYEFIAYYLSFYKFKDNRTDEVKTLFNNAWNYHQKFNDHHWQFWILINDTEDEKFLTMKIPKIPLLELIADWGSFKNKLFQIQEYYDKNKEKTLLHSKTRKELEEYLLIFKELDI